MSHLHPLLVAAAMATIGTRSAGAQPATSAGTTAPEVTFVVLLGKDTLAVERYTRTATALSGQLTSPSQRIVQSWWIDLAPGDGQASGARTAVSPLGDDGNAASGKPLQSLAVSLVGDSAVLSGDGGERRIAVPAGTLPYVNLSAGVLEQILRQARSVGGDQVTLSLLPFGSLQTIPAAVRWSGPDSAAISIGGAELHAQLDADGSLLGAEVPSQGARFVRASGDLKVEPVAPPDYSAPPGAPYTATDVTVRNEVGGVTLAGTLTVPRDASSSAPVPAVVLITGSGSQDRDSATPLLPGYAPFREIADSLGRRGIAVLRLDDRGVGGSQRGDPGATSEDFAGDIRAALAFLRQRPEIDPARLALAGHSEGAMIAPMVAVSDSALAAIVLMAAPSRSGRVISDAQVAQVMKERGVPAAERDSLARLNDREREKMVAASPWLKFFFSYDPLPTARRLRLPVLIIQGETDHQVSPDQAGELAAAIRAGGDEDVTVKLIPEVNHLLVHDPSGALDGGYGSLASLKVEPAVLGAIADWLSARLVR